tara:strand:+ start:498 stop:1070 length:573 start_codon:yes stop_codon:yes gene_type:complete
MAQTQTHQPDDNERTTRTRRPYYRGDVDCPAQYHVLRCTNSHTHHAPNGRYDARKGCGQYFVNFTAKHWGHKADWQSTCPTCGRKQRRHRGHIIQSFETKDGAWRLANWLTASKNMDRLRIRMMIEYRETEQLPMALYDEYHTLLHNHDGDLLEHELKELLDAEYKPERIEEFIETLVCDLGVSIDVESR